MDLGGPGRDEELGPDLGVTQAFGGEASDVELGRREAGPAGGRALALATGAAGVGHGRLDGQRLPLGPGRLEGLVAGVRGANHLDERQHGCGIEAVHPDDALRGLRRLGDLRDRERRRIRGEDGRRRDDPVQLGEELPLDVEVLEGGFDHEPARGELGQVGDE